MAPSLVQSASNTATSGTSVTVTLGSSTTAGNCLVVYVGEVESTTNPTVSGITLGGNAGNFAQAGAAINDADANCEIWTDQNCAGGQTSVVVTFNAGTGTSQANEVLVEEWSGIALSGAVDKTNGQNAGSASWSSGSSGTLSQASELVVGAVSVFSAPTITGPSSPWVNQAQISASTNGAMLAGHQVVSATTAQTYSGTIASSIAWGAVIVTLKAAASTTPAPFRPVRSARGKPAAVRGTGRGSPRTPVKVFPGSPFQKPAKPARGAPAAVRGTGKALPGRFTAPLPPSPFYLPVRPARGATAIRGTGHGHAGAAYVFFPSPFALPVRPSKGAAAAVRGRSKSSPGARYVLVRVSPFTLPRGPARGTAAIRRGSWSEGSATGQGSPFTPRQLIISAASAAGTDDYGNAFPQGLLATAGVIQGPVIIGSNAFYYNGTPGAGNLAASISAGTGTDAFGNAYVQGLASYNTALFFSAVAMFGGVITWFTAASQAGPYTTQSAITFSQSGGHGGITLSATGISQIGASAGCYWDDQAQVLHIPAGTVNTAGLTVNGNTVTVGAAVNIPQAEPTGASSAPATYSQSQMATVVNAIDNTIIALRNAGIFT